MSIIKVSRVRDVCNERVKICTLFLHFIKLYTDMSRLPWSFKKEEKKKKCPYRLITQETKKKKTKNIALQIIGTIIEIENYIHNTVSRFSLDKYFPLEKNIENPWTSDSSNSHSDDINNRSNNDPSHPNKSSNFEYRNKHENPPNIPPSLPHPPRCPSLETSDVHDGNGSERKIRFTEFLLPSFSSPFPFFSANLSAEKSPP